MPGNAQVLQTTDIATVEQFDTFIKTNPKAVVIFRAGWCGPCNKLGRDIRPSQEVEDVRSKLEVEIGFVDVDEAHEVAGMLGVRSIPYTTAYKNGTPIEPHGTHMGWTSGSDNYRFAKWLEGWYE